MSFNVVAGPTDASRAYTDIQVSITKWVDETRTALEYENPETQPEGVEVLSTEEYTSRLNRLNRDIELLDVGKAAAVLLVNELGDNPGEMVWIQIAGHGDPANQDSEHVTLSVRRNPGALRTITGEQIMEEENAG